MKRLKYISEQYKFYNIVHIEQPITYNMTVQITFNTVSSFIYPEFLLSKSIAHCLYLYREVHLVFYSGN